jgi:hypothetical protein
MYDHEFILKDVGHGEYELVSSKGFSLTSFNRCANQEEAMTKAKAWASSWTSVCIKMDDEQST